MNFLAVKNLSFAYHGSRRPVLDGVSFTVAPGEHIALVGPNGSGKSTLFSLIAGFLRPLSGAVCLDDREIRKMPARRRARRLALVPQGKPAGFPYTCLEFVLMGLHPYEELFAEPEKKALDEAEALMRKTGVFAMASKQVTALSGGEFQRVILTRALLQLLHGENKSGEDGDGAAPKLLLLDEALSELDINARIAVMKMLCEISEKRGIAIVGIHHDLHLAWRFARRIIALKDGAVAGDGTPDGVFTGEFFARVFHVEAEIVPGRGFFFNDEINDRVVQ
jgi:iron complex transport system ATP-binding protein